MSTHKKLARSAGSIGFFTGISRVLGFIRDLVIASAFGTGVAAEAFVVSFKIPNLLRDLVGEGATNAAIVPVLTECRERKQQDYWKLVSTLLALMAVILSVLAVLGVLFAPGIVSLIAPGFRFSAEASKFPLTVHLTRVIFPYIFLIGLSALAMGVLNSLHEFTSSAVGPCLLNLSMIISGVYFERYYGPMALVVAVLIGGALQLGCQLPALMRSGFKWERPDLKLAEIGRIGRLFIPRAFGSALYQVNIFVDSILASFESIVGSGGQSALYYANRLFQLPLAIFGLSLAQAVLPTFSSQMVRRDLDAFKATLSVSIRTLILVITPALVGLVVLTGPIVRILFQHGHFNAYSSGITSTALFFYAFGLLSCALIKILVNAFYAMQDTRTPLKFMGIAVAVNAVLSAGLMFPLKIGGITLASSVSATLNITLLYMALQRRIGPLGGARIFRSFVKIAAASLLMGVVASAYDHAVLDRMFGASRWVQTLCLLGGIGLCMAVYAGLTYALKIEELKKLLQARRA